MKGKLIRLIFWVLVAVFVIVAATMFVPAVGRLPVRLIGLPAYIVLAGLGVTLVVLTVAAKIAGRLKKFLLLTGASAIGFPVFAVLHNLVSGLFNIEEPVFFILAIILCPLSFLVGAVASVVLTVKNT